MTTKRWLLIFLIVILICVALLFWQRSIDHGSVVCITQDGALICTLDLSKVDAPYSFPVQYGNHYNLVQVTGETVWVSESDCDNQVCVDHGPLREGGTPITCLPHRLVIFWKESRVNR